MVLCLVKHRDNFTFALPFHYKINEEINHFHETGKNGKKVTEQEKNVLSTM
jgi:hypothetical protein